MPSYLLQPGDIISIKSKEYKTFEKDYINYLTKSLDCVTDLEKINFFKSLDQNKPVFSIDLEVKQTIFDRGSLNSLLLKNNIKSFIKILLKDSSFSDAGSKNTRQENKNYYQKNRFNTGLGVISLKALEKISFFKPVSKKSFLFPMISQLESHSFFSYNSFSNLQFKRYIIKKANQKQNLIAMRYSAMKPLHIEVSYKIFTAIYLYFPQKITFPASIDLDLVCQSF